MEREGGEGRSLTLRAPESAAGTGLGAAPSSLQLDWDPEQGPGPRAVWISGLSVLFKNIVY